MIRDSPVRASYRKDFSESDLKKRKTPEKKRKSSEEKNYTPNTRS